MKYVIAFAAILAGSSLIQGADARRPARTMQTERIEIVDAKGQVRIGLGAKDGVAIVYLNDAAGEPRCMVQVGDEGPQIVLGKGDGARVIVGAHDASASVAVVGDGKAAGLLTANDKRAAVQLVGADGKPGWVQRSE